MKDNQQDIKDDSQAKKPSVGGVSFLKVDALVRGSHALSLFLKTDDIIVGIDKKTFRGTQKLLNETIKDNSKTVLTVFRKDTFFNVIATRPLGISLVETGSDEDALILEKVTTYLDKIKSFDNFKEYEVFRGKGHRYNIIEVNEASLFASLFPLIWFFHYKLYLPLFLIIMLFILLEIFGMIKEYYFQNRIAFSYPIFIAITALARLIILQRKDFDPVLLLYESGAILILAAAIVILRLRYLDVLVKNRKVGGGQ